MREEAEVEERRKKRRRLKFPLQLLVAHLVGDVSVCVRALTRTYTHTFVYLGKFAGQRRFENIDATGCFSFLFLPRL